MYIASIQLLPAILRPNIMKLKTAILLVDISVGFLILPAMLGIVYCFMVLKGGAIVIGCLSILILFVCAFLLKKNLINYYLKRCKYPREFLSVLEKRGIMSDLQISWGDDVNKAAEEPQVITQRFLADNNLSTKFGSPQNEWLLPSVVSAMSAAGLFFFTRDANIGDNILLIFIVAALLVGNVYLWTHRTKAASNDKKVVSFEAEGLFMNGDKYDWQQIEDWGVLSSDTSSELEILYNRDGKGQKVLFNMEQTNASEIELLLLLSHFKAAYG